MLTLETNLETYCQNHRYNHYFFHKLFEAWVVVSGVFTKLRFRSRSKKFGNRSFSHYSMSGWSFF